MDVVPADASRWTRDPFGGEIAEGRIWGRGAMDMKGPGVAHLYAFIMLKRQKVALDRDIILMAVPDEEVGGALGALWMRDNHYQEFEPEYILDEGGFGSRDLFTPGKLVFGVSVAEKKILWLKLTAEGVAGHGSQPHDKNPNDRLVRALARLLSEPMPTSPFSVLETFKSRVGTLAVNKFNNAIQHSTISITSLRSGVGEPPEGERHSVDCRGDARLPRVAGNDEGAVVEGDRAAAWRSGNQGRRHLRVAGPGRDDHRFGVLPRARERGAEALPRGHLHADDRALRHRFEQLSARAASRATASPRRSSPRKLSPRCTAMPSTSPSTRLARRSGSSSKRSSQQRGSAEPQALGWPGCCETGL